MTESYSATTGTQLKYTTGYVRTNAATTVTEGPVKGLQPYYRLHRLIFPQRVPLYGGPFCIQRKAMFRTLINLTASCALLLSSIAHAGIVIESTRYLYKEGAREITAQIENKDDIPISLNPG